MNRVTFLPIVRKFFEHDPAAAAHSLETMDEEEAILILKSLPTSLTVQAFQHLETSYAARLLNEIPSELFKEIVEKISPMQGSLIFLALPEESKRNLVDKLPDKIRQQIQELLFYPEESVGRIMSRDFSAFQLDMSVREAIQSIRLHVKKKSIASYVYVIDRNNHIEGVINMRDLLLASPSETLGKVMRTDLFAVNCFDDKNDVATELGKRRFFSAPVIDAERHLLGTVHTEQLLSEVQDDATEDIQMMFGAGGDERPFSSVRFSISKRLPWLYVNLLTAFTASAVISLFEDLIARLTILAVFLPVVAGQGGNAGAQSLAVVMRGIVMREIPKGRVIGLIIKEARMGLLNGLAIGVVTAAIAWVWHGNPVLGLVIGLAMIVNLVAAGVFGAGIPLAMRALRFDPAQSSSIVLTTVTDVVGFLSFLGFALAFERYLY